MTGKLLCLQYKYGNKNNLFATYEETLALVKKYPVVYGVIPKKFKDKAMTLEFLRANKIWVDEYNEMRECERREQEKDARNGIYRCHAGGRYVQFTDNAYVIGGVDLGALLKDEEVLVAALDNKYPLSLGPDAYDESTIIKVMNERQELVWYVFCYWQDYIQDYPIEIEKIRNKYRLFNNPNDLELAFFKCLSLITPTNKNALACLVASLYNQLDIKRPTDTDNLEEFQRIFACLDVEPQNYLVSRFYACAKYVKKGVLYPETEKEVVDNCPIAGDILSDEAILKYKLVQSDTLQEVTEKCEECDKCMWSKIEIIN